MSSSSASGPSAVTPSRSRRLVSRQTAKARSRTGAHPPRTQNRIQDTAKKIAPKRSASKRSVSEKPASKKTVSKKTASKKPLRAPRPIRQLVRWLVRGPKKSPRKVLMAGGSVATLAVLVIVPTRVGSQAIALSSCQEVVQSGAEISRAQVASLLAVPEGSRREAVRQVIDVPYCLLPTPKENTRGRVKNSDQVNDQSSEQAGDQAGAQAGEKANAKESETVTDPAATMTAREAYPLAFDPEAWVVVRYTEGEYAGYDFVFKP